MAAADLLEVDTGGPQRAQCLDDGERDNRLPGPAGEVVDG